MSNGKLFLTANTFFGRHKALDLPKRKIYKDVIAMNNAMIEKWNSVVGLNDTVYHLGFFAHDPNTTNDVLEHLNGNICFLNNGTDKSLPDVIHMYDFVIMLDNQVFEISGKKTILCYHPLEVWEGTNSYHFYGDERVQTNLEKVSNRMNISFDVWGKPIGIDACIDLIEDFKKSESKKTI